MLVVHACTTSVYTCGRKAPGADPGRDFFLFFWLCMHRVPGSSGFCKLACASAESVQSALVPGDEWSGFRLGSEACFEMLGCLGLDCSRDAAALVLSGESFNNEFFF